MAKTRDRKSIVGEKMTGIFHALWINASLDTVYAAVKDKSGLAGWWTRSVDGDGEVGGVSTFRFSSGVYNRMRIRTLEQNLIEWDCIDGHVEWIGTHVAFELRQGADGVKVCFSHFGWREKTEYLGDCSFHWAHYLTSLQKYCETGSGMPNDGFDQSK